MLPHTQLHAKAPQLYSIMGYLNFRGMAVTYNDLLGTSNEGDELSFEMFLNEDFSPEIILHLLLGRYALPLEAGFLSYDYFVHPDKTPLEATGRLLAKTRPPKDQVLIQSLVKRGIRAGHIRDYNGQDTLEDALPMWQAMAASDPGDANFLKSAEQLAAAKKAAAAAAAAAAATIAEEKPAANPFLAMVKSAEQKATGTSDSSAAEKPAATAGTTTPGTFAAPAAGSKFTFQMPSAGGTAPAAKFTFKPQATSNVDLAAASQRRRQAKAAKDS
jgi:hypothetical protein